MRLIAALVATGLMAEIAARALLFSRAADGLDAAERLREPSRLGHPDQDLYWIVQSDFAEAGGAELVPVPDYDPLVGWLGGGITPGERVHRDAASVGERRPVLLYGDSYAACVVPSGSCFQDYLERGPLGATHRMVNYGVGGYGLDQAALLLEATVDAFVDRDPVVVLGILVDDDLDRCAVSYRGWPKPRFERSSSGAGFGVTAVPSERPGRPFATSYALRLLAHGDGAVGAALHDSLCDRGRREALNRERCRAILARANEAVQARGLEAFVVLFFAPNTIEHPERNGWREPFLVEALDELGLPWVSTRATLLSNVEASGRPLEDYYLSNGHLSPLGNEVALRAITEGIAGRFGAEVGTSWSEAQLRGALSADRIAEVVLGDEGSAARYEYGFRPPFGRVEADRSRLCYRVSGERPTEVRYDLGGAARSFRATAKFIPMEQFEPDQGSVRLRLIADGEVVFERATVRGDEPFEVRADLTGRRGLSIALDTGGDDGLGDWFVLTSPVFE